MKSLQALRGMRDILPPLSQKWRYVYETLNDILADHGYLPMELPLLESTQLFQRSIGEVTDIVEKEMYTFLDRNEESITLRPEGTAGCVRALIEHGLAYNQAARYMYTGPMFRYERPQRGRFRQFYQCGVETFGVKGPQAEVELILVSKAIFDYLEVKDITLKINTLGNTESRMAYREALYKYFSKHKETLNADAQERLEKNPLRLLDSKDPKMADLIANAPIFTDYLDDTSRTHFGKVLGLLDALGIPYVQDPKLVRGLDYYNDTVFEWTTQSLGAQGAVCGGGRYDSLVEQMGGISTTAVGMAFGIDRLVELLPEEMDVSTADIYILVEEAPYELVFAVANDWRQEFFGLRIVVDISGASFKSQMKAALASGAACCVVFNAETADTGIVKVGTPGESLTKIELGAVQDLFGTLNNEIEG